MAIFIDEDMKEIEQVISRYLGEKETDYAIMINGEWGCGKTYYVRHNLSNCINSIPYQIKHGDTKKYSAVYVSLYGLSNIEELPYLLAKSVLPFLDGKLASSIRGFAGGFANYFGIEKENFKEFSKLFEIRQDKVLIFDDLERINFEKVHIKEVLGAINQYVEVGRLKAIVISDESKIDAYDDFKNFKEKTIRYTLKFHRPLSESFDDIVSEKENGDYLAFLKEQKELILKVFQLGRCKNLRTLISVIDTFRELFIKVKEEKYASDILKDLLISLLVYSIEYKNGEKKEDLEKLKELTSYLGWLSNREDERNRIEYIDKLWDKYNDINYDYHYYPVINEYVVNGYLDENEIDSLVSELGTKYGKQEETPEGELFKKICNWRLIEDEDFLLTIKETIVAVEAAKYSIEELTELYYQFLKFEYYEIEEFKFDSALDETFRKSAEIVMKANGFDLYIETRLFHFTSNIYGEALLERYKEYINYIGEINRGLRKDRDQNIIAEFMDCFRKGDTGKMDKFFSGLNCKYLFENLDPHAVSEVLFVSKVSTIEGFRGGIYDRYPDELINNQLSQQEMNFIKGLYGDISVFLDNQHPKKMSSVWYQMMLQKLKRILGQCGEN